MVEPENEGLLRKMTAESEDRCICGQQPDAHEPYTVGSLIHLLSIGNRKLPLSINGRKVVKLILNQHSARLLLEHKPINTNAKEALRKEYLDHIKIMRDYWLNQKGAGAETEFDRMNGLIFSILVMLDGEASVPPCHVIPMKSTKNGKAWISTKIDIAGCLHEVWSKHEP